MLHRSDRSNQEWFHFSNVGPRMLIQLLRKDSRS